MIFGAVFSLPNRFWARISARFCRISAREQIEADMHMRMTKNRPSAAFASCGLYDPV
jgi:hypothetical protein